MEDEESCYRQLLETLKQKSQDSYDKTVLSLSAGALGLSFAFVTDIVSSWPPQAPNWLFAAWICWSISVTSVLFSFLCSQKALRRTIEQVDAGKMHNNNLGGYLNKVTIVLNYAAGLCFLLGVTAMIFFVGHNMERTDNGQNKQTQTNTEIHTNSQATTSSGNPSKKRARSSSSTTKEAKIKLD